MPLRQLRPARPSPTLPILATDRWQPTRSPLRRQALRYAAHHWKLLLGIVAAVALEVVLHARTFAITRPATNIDAPFHIGCQEPVLNTTARASAALVMLARNSDLEGAVKSVRSMQQQFNRNYGYPWVFLNDEPWTAEFKSEVSAAAKPAAGELEAPVSFHTIPAHMWGFPEWVDQARARKSMRKMESQGISYAGKESYHHMCRFNSGFFYDHPALQPYRWYWRVEPDVSFTCAITYDPFVEMAAHDKRYGYTVALWEQGKTAPSLFRKLSAYKQSRRIASGALWTAMMDASWLPWPLRRLMWWSRNRDDYGDLWNTCHFWSNFEIADLNFFRSKEYRDLFAFLDQDGGFYYERWGDAPIHSLAAAMLLKPEQVHHFADFGYVHEPFQYCTYASTPNQLAAGKLVPNLDNRYLNLIPEKEIGCNCNCDPRIKMIRPACFNRLRSTVM